MKAEVRSTRAYRDLTDAEWQWALDFVTRGGDALKAYPDYHKVVRDEHGVYRVKDAAIAKRHRMSIGTIVSDAAVDIRYIVPTTCSHRHADRRMPRTGLRGCGSHQRYHSC